MPARNGPGSRLLPSLTDVAFLIPILLLFGRLNGFRNLLSDGDTGWHIRAGEWMLDHGAVPTVDLFSYTRPDAPWYAWEWLWDVAFALLYRAGGMTAVVVVSLGVIGLTFALLYRLALRVSGNCLLASVITLVAAICSSIHWLARPHLFTLLFTVLTLHVLIAARQGRPRLLWWMIPLAVVWTNLHGGFVAGLLLLGGAAAGELTASLFETESTRRTAILARARGYLAATAGFLAATFVNPYGYRLHQHIYTYLTDKFHLHNVDEMQSVNFHHPGAPFFELMIVLGVLSAGWFLARREFVYPIWIFGWLHLALMAGRNLPIYVLVATPVIAVALRDMLGSFEQSGVPAWPKRAVAFLRVRAARFGEIERLPRLPWLSAAALLGVALAGLSADPPEKFRATYSPARYPEKALAALGDLDPGTRIFTHDEWGDYLIYRLYPQIKVFVDGRSDFYGPEFCERYLDVMRVRHDWERILDDYRVSVALLPVQAALASVLKESPNWVPGYDDGHAIVFHRGPDAGSHTSLLSRAPQVSAGESAGGIKGASPGNSQSTP